MEPRRKWADSESDDEEVEEVEKEHIITSLPSLEVNSVKPVKQKKKVKVKKEEPEEKVDPNLVTKLSNVEVKVENKNLRSDGTTASKKERKEKELEELNKLLAELGTVPEAEVPQQNTDVKEEEKEKGAKSKKPKTSKKELFEAVRSEINARAGKNKKGKKKDKYSNYK